MLDEPYWVWCVREYVVPSFVFSFMVYYLVRKVLLPLRHLRGVTRRSAEEITAAHETEEEEAKKKVN